MKANMLDRAIGYFAPGAAARRLRNRVAYDVLSRHYDGADQGRLNNSWRTGSTSANTEIDRAGYILRNRMRDLVRNNPHAANAVEVLVNHVIGSGIRPRANTGNPKKDKKINAIFEKFSKKCDADGQLDFYGLQTLTFREMVESGDGIVRRRRRLSTDGFLVPVQYQVLETDLLDSNRNGPTIDGRTAIQGVEFDLLGKRTAYWMYTTHPGESYVSAPLDLLSKAIPASEIAHLYKKDRTQVRGVPWGHAVITALRDLGTYEEAEILRKKLESCMVGVVTNGDEGDSAIGLSLAADPNAAIKQPGVYDSQGVAVEGFEPGMFVHLEGGKDIKFNQPAATGSYEGYKKASLHTIASGFHIPYLLLSHDLSGANYASSKMGLEPFKRLIEAIQWNFVIPMLCQPMWDWFAEAAYFAGLVDSAEIPVLWGPPRMYSADPEKDAKATNLEIRTGLKTLPQAISERGEDPDTQLDEIAATNKKLDDRKLILDSDPRRQSMNGQTQLSPAAADETPPAS